MPVILDLQENGRVLYARIVDPWTVPELLDSFVVELEYRNKSDSKIHTLLDLREMRHVPPSIISVASRTPSMKHPRRGAIAAIGASTFARKLVEIIIRLTHAADAKFFDTEADARAYLLDLIANENQPALNSH